jgi:hypothetical protein
LVADEATPRFVELALTNEQSSDLGLRNLVLNRVREVILKQIKNGEVETSEKKKHANKTNAKRGGVKTPQGKAISCRNSLKHGILAHGSVEGDILTIEEAYKQFSKEFSPRSPSREILVQQLALTVVRLGRCSRFETEILHESKVWMWDISNTIDRLAALGERYESRLVRRMLRLLEALNK